MLRDSSQHLTSEADRETGGSYSRKRVCRLLGINARQLKIWEKQQLIAELDEYRFADLLSLKTIIRLRAEKCRPQAIREALDALRMRLLHLPDGHKDVRVYKDGRRIRLQIGKQHMESASGQLLIDFAEQEISNLLQLPVAEKSAASLAEKVRNRLEADRWFEKGLELERIGAPFEEIIGAYTKASELDPTSAGALVNLGTVFFHGHAWKDAESRYAQALEIDPNYALAHFNLANLYDEQGDLELAVTHYRQALKLSPGYADAHYNLALLYQGTRDSLGAMRHWREYLRLDATSSWAEIARRELQKLQSSMVIEGKRDGLAKMDRTRTKGSRV